VQKALQFAVAAVDLQAHAFVGGAQGDGGQSAGFGEVALFHFPGEIMEERGDAVARKGIAGLQLLKSPHQLLVLVAQSGGGELRLALGKEEVE
jgi:hypothetical protein